MLKNILNSHYFLWCVLAVPAGMALYGYWTDALTYGEVIHSSGEWAARLLIVTMAVTPLRLMFPRANWPLWLMRRRRDLGVATFAYALLHTLVYLQRKADLALIIEEGLEPDLLTGWLAFVLFVALAVTSNNASVRLLKRAWKNLHRFVYPAAILTFLHWAWAAFDMAPALVYASILAGLEIVRIILSLWRARQRPA